MKAQACGSEETRKLAWIAEGTSLVKYVSDCGPFGMSSHSVSCGRAGEGRTRTMTVGCIRPSCSSLSAAPG